MRTRSWWLACLLGTALFWMPATAQAQDKNVGNPSWEFPLPLMWGDKDTGPYFAAEALFMRLNNPMRSQLIAVRGFWDDSGQLDGRGDRVQVVLNDPPSEFLAQLYGKQGIPGHFVGSKAGALSAADIGEDQFQPGYRMTIGWRLRNDIAIEFVFFQLADYQHAASAGVVEPGIRGFGVPGIGAGTMADTFLSSPFFNFGPEFGGPERDVVSNVLQWPKPPGQAKFFADTAPDTEREVEITPAELADLRRFAGIPLPAFGVWNAAEIMTIELTQRIYNSELNCRLPVNQTECDRTTMLVGARYINIFEHFRFRTVDLDVESLSTPADVAIYDNEWQNRLYGGQIGMGYESYIGQGFAWGIEGRIGLFLDYRKTHVQIARGDEDAIQWHRDDTSLSPMGQVGAFLWWYPLEGVQCRAGYEFMALLNVRRAEQPVSFNVGNLDPTYEDMLLRLDGFSLGLAFIF